MRLAPLFALALTGCFGYGTYQSADTLGEGRMQAGAEGAAIIGIAQGDADVLSIPKIGGRFVGGVTDTIDLGVRLSTTGVDLMSKFQLTERGAPDFIASIAPELGGFYAGDDLLVLRGQLAALLGVGFGDGHQVVVGPRVGALWLDVNFFGRSQGAVFSAGSSLGVWLELGDLVRLVPEVSLLYPFAGLNDSGDGSTNTTVLFIEAGLGLLFEFGGA